MVGSNLGCPNKRSGIVVTWLIIGSAILAAGGLTLIVFVRSGNEAGRSTPTPEPVLSDPVTGIVDPWYAVEPKAWAATCAAIDSAVEEDLSDFNEKALALYNERVLRFLGYMYAYLIVCKAGEDLLGASPSREAVDQLTADLGPEWAQFRMADPVHLSNTLVRALRSRKEADQVLNSQPRIEHAVVAAALLLRRLNKTSSNQYRERVQSMLRENPVADDELERLRPA